MSEKRIASISALASAVSLSKGYADSLRESNTETHQAPDKHRLKPEFTVTVTQSYLLKLTARLKGLKPLQTLGGIVVHVLSRRDGFAKGRGYSPSLLAGDWKTSTNPRNGFSCFAVSGQLELLTNHHLLRCCECGRCQSVEVHTTCKPARIKRCFITSLLQLLINERRYFPSQHIKYP